jgi:hypothetical protein
MGPIEHYGVVAQVLNGLSWVAIIIVCCPFLPQVFVKLDLVPGQPRCRPSRRRTHGDNRRQPSFSPAAHRTAPVAKGPYAEHVKEFETFRVNGSAELTARRRSLLRRAKELGVRLGEDKLTLPEALKPA